MPMGTRLPEIPPDFLNLYSYKGWLVLTFSIPLVCLLSFLFLFGLNDLGKSSLVSLGIRFLYENNNIFSLLFIAVIILLAIKLPISNSSKNTLSQLNRTYYIVFRLLAFFLWYISTYILIFVAIKYLGAGVGLSNLGDSALYLAKTLSLSFGILMLAFLSFFARRCAD